jgi:glycosyltransferase involved in cell wall biosynthesis
MGGRMAGVPVVRTIHNSVYWESWRRLGLWCDRRMADSCVACVSNAARDAFCDLRAESCAAGAPRSPVVIYNGVDVEGYRHAERRPSCSPVRILYAGRFEEQKGVDLLPEIVRRVRLPETTRCQLEIYGSGTHDAALRRFALDPPKGWTIDVGDPVADIKDRLSHFDLLIMPSRYEGLGIMAVEAAKLDLPAIVTNAPGLREAFPDGYAFAAEAGNAESFAERLTHALTDPDALCRAAGQARLFAERRFDAPGMCEAYAEIYRHVLKTVEAGGASRTGGFAPGRKAGPVRSPQ